MSDTSDNSSNSGPEEPLINSDDKRSIGLHVPPVIITGGESFKQNSFLTEREIPPDVRATITRVHSGPIPPALDFGEYERVLPGAGQWLLDQAALDAAHMRDMDRDGLKFAKLQAILHHVAPALTVCVALVASAVIAILASPGWGATAFATTIASILAAYLTGKPWSRGPDDEEADDEEVEKDQPQSRPS